jgi:hypothetical protein
VAVRLTVSRENVGLLLLYHAVLVKYVPLLLHEMSLGPCLSLLCVASYFLLVDLWLEAEAMVMVDCCPAWAAANPPYGEGVKAALPGRF